MDVPSINKTNNINHFIAKEDSNYFPPFSFSYSSSFF